MMNTDLLTPASTINNRYEVVKCLGAGSMGMVYLCRDTLLSNRLIALKVLFPHVARSETVTARFLNEIAVSYEVSHENVVRTYDYFRTESLVALTMEYVSGGDLADRLEKPEVMPIPEIVRMLSQIALGVRAIHAAGIIHRDLKPENILLTSTGDVKISDFGIARMNEGQKLTEAGGVLGTMDYVSPEYLTLGTVDTRADLYALGTIAYEMIAGRLPFEAKNVVDSMNMKTTSDPKSPSVFRKDCPKELSEIVLRLLSRDPEIRFQTADELLVDLRKLQPGGTQEEAPQVSNTVSFAKAARKKTKSNFRTGSAGTKPRAGVAVGNTVLKDDSAKYRGFTQEDFESGRAALERVLVPRHLAFAPQLGADGSYGNIEIAQSRLSNPRVWDLKQESEIGVAAGFWSYNNLLMLALTLGISLGVFLGMHFFGLGDKSFFSSYKMASAENSVNDSF